MSTRWLHPAPDGLGGRVSVHDVVANPLGMARLAPFSTTGNGVAAVRDGKPVVAVPDNIPDAKERIGRTSSTALPATGRCHRLQIASAALSDHAGDPSS